MCVPADPPGPLVLGQRHSLQGLHWVTPGHGRSFRAAVVWAPQAPGTDKRQPRRGVARPGTEPAWQKALACLLGALGHAGSTLPVLPGA